jgi:TIR domain/Pentapeptide repeats (8 copies)
MANREHLQILQQGVDAWNSWRVQNRAIIPDISQANLAMANLAMANLTEANLTRAALTGANLSQVVLAGTVFADTPLTTVLALETCSHRGSSILDHRTLAKSGPLPLAFLRGCGLPESLIEYLPSLLGETVQFYSCFISYSSADEAFCRRLHEHLQNAGLRVWFAPYDVQGGRKIHEQIDQAIRVYDKLLLVLSPHSMQSPWVEFEIRRARRREVAEHRRLLFPVRLVEYEAIKAWECIDADTAKDLATEIREYYIPDFTAWKDHDAFEAAVSRLLRDLKAEGKQS